MLQIDSGTINISDWIELALLRIFHQHSPSQKNHNLNFIKKAYK